MAKFLAGWTDERPQDDDEEEEDDDNDDGAKPDKCCHLPDSALNLEQMHPRPTRYRGFTIMALLG